MHRHHFIPVRHLHLGEALVAQDAGVVHQDVDTAPLVQGLLDHGADLFLAGHVGAVGDRFTAGGLDLFDHFLRRFAGTAGAVAGAAEIIDHHLGAQFGQRQRVGFTQAVGGAGDDRHPALEINTHAFLLRGASSSVYPRTIRLSHSQAMAGLSTPSISTEMA